MKAMNITAKTILENVEKCIEELKAAPSASEHDYGRLTHKGYDKNKGWYFEIDVVCNELNIFDWWNDTLSLSQLKSMRKFLKTAIELGFDGYVCFKVGAAGCSHGMWAHKDLSTNGFSPDGDFLFHSFRSGDNYYDMKLNDVWMQNMDMFKSEEDECRYEFTLKEVKEALKGVK